MGKLKLAVIMATSVAADLQSDTKYYKDFQSVMQ